MRVLEKRSLAVVGAGDTRMILLVWTVVGSSHGLALPLLQTLFMVLAL